MPKPTKKSEQQQSQGPPSAASQASSIDYYPVHTSPPTTTTTTTNGQGQGTASSVSASAATINNKITPIPKATAKTTAAASTTTTTTTNPAVGKGKESATIPSANTNSTATGKVKASAVTSAAAVKKSLLTQKANESGIFSSPERMHDPSTTNSATATTATTSSGEGNRNGKSGGAVDKGKTAGEEEGEEEEQGQEILSKKTKTTPNSKLQGKKSLDPDQKLSKSLGRPSRNGEGGGGGGSPSRNNGGSPIGGHSIPKAIPRRPSQIKVATPTSLFMMANNNMIPKSMTSNTSGNGQNVNGYDSPDEGASDFQPHSIVAEHLVQAPGEMLGNTRTSGASFGSMSHNLKGGAITRDIYKWQESREQQPRPRSNSNPEVSVVASPSIPNVRTLREPGAFRRHFIANKAKREGKKPPNFLTSNFIDFLILYGYYGGDVYPSDDEEEDEDDYFDAAPSAQPDGGSGSTSRLRGRQDEDIEALGENAPLLRPAASSSAASGTSESKAFFMLVKAFVGTGVLFLPKAFSNGGLVFSFISMLIIGYLTKHCMILLVDTSRAFGGKSFGDLGQIIYGERMKQLVLGSIAVSQMGFCCAYFIFVGQNLRDLLMIVSDCKLILPDWFFIAFQLVFYIPLAWVRKIKNFGITSLIADVFIMAGLGYIFVYDLTLIGETGIQPVPWINLQSFPLFIGTAMFAFEGICLMLPIAESMKEPEKFHRVLDHGMIFVGVIFISIGALGYLALGEDVETIIFLNLPKSPAVSTLQFFYAISIMLSFPLCVYPAIRITEQAIFGLSTGKGSSLIKWEKNLYRATITCFLGLLAWAGSTNLDKVVSLVGCFACIPLSFIYPALFHTHITENKWVKLKDWLVVIFGTIAMIFTTFITIQQWYAQGAELPLDRCQNGKLF